MPVRLEHVQQPSEQDQLDLQKLYADYPVAFSYEELQQQLQDNPDMQLHAGRFNDRLLGAFTLKADGDTAVLDHLCVRKITRQRTVGRELLRLVMKEGNFKNYQLTSCIKDEGLDTFFSKMGFTKDGNSYHHP